MVCTFCQSERLYLKQSEGKIGLYCKSCGRWIRWVGPEERPRLEKDLERQRREVRIEGADVDRVMQKYASCVKQYRQLSDDLSVTRDIVAQNGSSIGKSALYAKALRLKELGIRIETSEEIFRALGLKLSAV